MFVCLFFPLFFLIFFPYICVCVSICLFVVFSFPCQVDNFGMFQMVRLSVVLETQKEEFSRIFKIASLYNSVVGF